MSEIFYIIASDANQTLQADIAPTLGGHCVNLRACQNGNCFPILEDVPFNRILASPTSYGCPILAPYAGRVANQSFTWQSQTYRVPQPRHGLVRHQVWQVIKYDNTHIACNTIVSPLFPPDFFPYHFSMRSEYTINATDLTIALQLNNLGQPFPYSIGLHPYFHLPQNGIKLYAPTAEHLILNQDLIPTGRTMPVTSPLDFRAGQLVTQSAKLDDFFTSLDLNQTKQTACSLVYQTNHRQITTSLTFNPQDFPCLCIYKPPERDAICVEPYTNAPNAFDQILGDQTVSLSVKISTQIEAL